MITTDDGIKGTLNNLKWLRDEWGDYWVAEWWYDGKCVGLTGSYYSLNEEGTARSSREEQEQNIAAEWIVDES